MDRIFIFLRTKSVVKGKANVKFAMITPPVIEGIPVMSYEALAGVRAGSMILSIDIGRNFKTELKTAYTLLAN